ncbi:hypothetical protein ACQR1Y_11915 [Bradyrhizobium sp. HKCCYLRH3099]
MIDDDDPIGPVNGHTKSEAVPRGCFWFVVAVIAFIALLGLYGMLADRFA